jgi:RNA polymerase sigma-70 factor (ECF subfamily)
MEVAMPSQVEGRTYPAEAELIRQAVRKDEAAIRAIIQQHNRRLYRVARSIVRDDADAEDVLQEAYLHAFSALAEFRGEAALATWLTRIVVNEALQRLRRPREAAALIEEKRTPGAQVIPFPTSAQQSDDPERAMAQREICQLVEHAIDELPQEFRTVLVARVIEGMSVEETADALALRPETVKTRLHRARRLLKAALAEHMGPLFSDVFPFDGKRCARVADAVVRRLHSSN